MGQLAFIREGTLFVHGGVNKQSLGYVPFSNTTFKSIIEWVENLNNWYKQEFQDWVQRPRWAYSKSVSHVSLHLVLQSVIDKTFSTSG